MITINISSGNGAFSVLTERRLSEHRQRNVVLLEGDEEDRDIKIVRFSWYFYKKTTNEQMIVKR